MLSKLKTMLEQHIGLRVYYPEIEHFYRDVQTGRIETPLPLDAVQEFVRGVGDHTPAVFEPAARDAIAGSAAPGPATAPPPTGSPVDPNQPAPPPDPLGEIDPRKARDFTFAGAVNNLWKVFREGEKVHKALDGWKKKPVNLSSLLFVESSNGCVTLVVRATGAPLCLPALGFETVNGSLNP